MKNIFILTYFLILCFTNVKGQNGIEFQDKVNKIFSAYDISLWGEPWEQYSFNADESEKNILIKRRKDGTICFLVEFFDNGKIKTVYSFFKNGLISSMQQYDSLKGVSGKYLEYFENGMVRISGEYIDSMRVGLRVYYFNTGKVQQELNYKNGLKNGEYKIFYENGNLMEIGNFVDGYDDGIINGYYEDGSKEYVYFYSNKEPTSEWIEYYNNGNVKEKINWDIINKFKIVTKYDDKGIQIEQLKVEIK